MAFTDAKELVQLYVDSTAFDRLVALSKSAACEDPEHEELLHVLNDILASNQSVNLGATLTVPSEPRLSSSVSSNEEDERRKSDIDIQEADDAPPDAVEGELEDDEMGAPVRINDYIIIRPLGKGTFGDVYQAICDQPGKENEFYALKFVRYQRARKIGQAMRRSSRAALKDSVAKMSKAEEQEFRIMRHLNHANICPVIELIDDPSAQCVCIVMPLFNRGPLEINPTSGVCTVMPEAEARTFFLQILRGVRYLHRNDVVHWDIKPDNVLIDPKTQEAALIDFGSSTDALVQSFAGRNPTQRGTPLFWAPEMFENDPDDPSGEVDPKAVDMWAIGVMLYAALCGKVPFFADDTKELVAAMRRGLPPPPVPLSEAALQTLRGLLNPSAKERLTVEGARNSQFFSASARQRASRAYSTMLTLDPDTHEAHAEGGVEGGLLSPASPMGGMLERSTLVPPELTLEGVGGELATFTAMQTKIFGPKRETLRQIVEKNRARLARCPHPPKS